MEKTMLIFDKIIYPNSLFEILMKYKFNPKECELQMFIDNSYVRAIQLFDTDKERLERTAKLINSDIWAKINSHHTIIFDGPEFALEVKNIREKVIAGIPEETFNDWFMHLTIHLSQLKIPINKDGSYKKRFLPGGVILYRTYKKGPAYSATLFISTESNLIEEPYLTELIKRVDKETKNVLIKNDRKNKINTKTRKRDPIESRLRHECFKRDNYICLECGKSKKETILHCDHIIPVSQGGSDELDNLQTLCQACNLAKSNRKWVAGN